MENIFQDKRGSLTDPIFSGAFILKIALTVIIAFIVWAGFEQVMTSVISGTPQESVLTPIISTLSSAYTSIDFMFPFLVGGLILVSTIFAFKTGANILWGIFSIIIWALAWLLATVFTNVYIAVTNAYPTMITSYPVMDAIMMNMRWVVLAWIAVISAVMFRKNNAEDEASDIQRRAYGA